MESVLAGMAQFRYVLIFFSSNLRLVSTSIGLVKIAI